MVRDLTVLKLYLPEFIENSNSIVLSVPFDLTYRHAQVRILFDIHCRDQILAGFDDISERE